MKVDLCDIKRMLRSEFFAKDRDVTLQVNRNFYLGDGTKVDSESNLLPDGAIVLMFSGAVVDIPDGWQLANGTNGTTDLRNRFIVGAGDTYDPGDTGGTSSHAHTSYTGYESNHTHADGSYAAANDTHSHGPGTLSTGGPSATSLVEVYLTALVQPASGSHTHDVTGGVTGGDTHNHDVTGTSGTGSSHRHGITGNYHLPPYYALCFIMRPS